MNYSLTTIHQGIRSLWQQELGKIEREITHHRLFKQSIRNSELELTRSCALSEALEEITKGITHYSTSI